MEGWSDCSACHGAGTTASGEACTLAPRGRAGPNSVAAGGLGCGGAIVAGLLVAAVAGLVWGNPFSGDPTRQLRWQGSYDCVAGTMGLEVDLDLTDGGGEGRSEVDAEVRYYADPPTADGSLSGTEPVAVVDMAGMATDGLVDLEGQVPTHATGFAGATLGGEIDLRDAPVFAGATDAPDCADFTLVER